jgi:hypothetical protein
MLAMLSFSVFAGHIGVKAETTERRPLAVSSTDASDYAAKLAVYNEARLKFEAEAAAYWTSVDEKRSVRFAKRQSRVEVLLTDYILTQPPVYAGPPRPVDLSAPKPEPAEPLKKSVPVVADFLRAAAEQYGVVPLRPQNEIQFKRAYAQVAMAAGLTKDQAVRVYIFEAGGDGAYDVQAGLENPNADARAISTALGYNQLLSTNSVELMAEQGDHFLAALKQLAAKRRGNAKKQLSVKIAVVERMVKFSRSVPDQWSEHEKLASTPQGLGIHAMNLDLDVGPLLQTQKLLDSVLFARRKGHAAALTAAELEMMNLTGDGNGFDMVTMPSEMRNRVPTSNFFHRAGYERNPVAARNNVVESLIAATDAKMDREMNLRGAADMAAAFGSK